MSQPTTTDRRTRRLSHRVRARAAILGVTGLAAAIAATLAVSGAAGASSAGDQTTTRSASMVEEGSGASGTTPASMVAQGSGASDAVGTTSTDPVTGVTVIDGDMLIAPQPQVVQETVTGSGAADAGGGAGAVPTDLHTVAPGSDAASSVERDVVTREGAVPAQGTNSIVAEGYGATTADPDTGVQVIDGDMLIAP